MYLTKRFHVPLRLFNNRSQMTSKCGKNHKVAKEAQLSVSLMFFPYFDLFCNLFLYTDPQQYGIYLFYKIIKNKQILMVTSTIHLCSSWNQSNVCIVQLIIYYLVDTTLHGWLIQAKMSAKGKRFTPYCFLNIFSNLRQGWR